MDSPFSNIEIVKASALKLPGVKPKLTAEEVANKHEMQCCLHLKRIIKSYFTRGIATQLKLNVSGLGEAKQEQLMNMWLDNDYEVVINGHIMEINPILKKE